MVHIDLKERIPMPGGYLRKTSPREFAADPGTWPDTTVPDHAQARVMLVIAARLRERVEADGRSLREIAAQTGVNRQTITNLMAGSSWADVLTISLLEDRLNVVLWPGAVVRASEAAR
ncbi:helix-turn-helix domain-containing protein [Kitasatospora griseola]|uniref:helix-turn-helix domain-containing protein n=1 Tax=Kitasatospora griseola TaxID=2064 RepID=UPI00382F799D